MLLLLILVYESAVKNQIPVVLMEGTGGCCDLFAKCFQLYNEYQLTWELPDQENSPSSKEKVEQMKDKIHEKLWIDDDTMASGPQTSLTHETIERDSFELIYECIANRSTLLNFIDVKAHSRVDADIDLAILQALLNEMNADRKHEQLNLAFEWKRIDIVKNSIMKDEKDWKVTHSPSCALNTSFFFQTIRVNNLFFKALAENQTSFVQLFLDHDFSLDDPFQDSSQLVALYENEVGHHSIHCEE